MKHSRRAPPSSSNLSPSHGARPLAVLLALAGCGTSASEAGLDANETPRDGATVGRDATAADADAAATPVPDGATAPICGAGTHAFGWSCRPDVGLRPVAPISLGNVTQRRPTLRWVAPAGVARVVVELCVDRACALPIETITASGTTARPSVDLPGGHAVFWRLRGADGPADAAPTSPTWLFHVPARSASGGVDTSANAHLDVNGDGLDDVVAGLPRAPGAHGAAGSVAIHFGKSSGVVPRPSRVLEGAAEGDYFGGDISTAGDVNGDGYGDLIVGAQLASVEGRSEAGTVSVYLGGPSGVSAAPDWLARGAPLVSRFGGAVSDAGDIDGDGYGDVIVGAFWSSPGGRQMAGTVHLYRGAPEGISPRAPQVLEGDAARGWFGYLVANAGDVDGDGYSDVLVGAPFQRTPGETWIGATMVFRGSTGGIVPTPDRLRGADSQSWFGRSIASAGDVNGDGYSDVVVGAHDAIDHSRPLTGTASVYQGSAAGLGTTAAVVLRSLAGEPLFGDRVAGAGDVNGDGYDDLILSEDTSAGAVHVFLGSPAGIPRQPASTFSGSAPGLLLGFAIAGVGDVNGDGYSDVAIGSVDRATPGTVGAVSVFLSGAMGVSFVGTALDLPDRRTNLGWVIAALSRHLRRSALQRS